MQWGIGLIIYWGIPVYINNKQREAHMKKVQNVPHTCFYVNFKFPEFLIFPFNNYSLFVTENPFY